VFAGVVFRVVDSDTVGAVQACMKPWQRRFTLLLPMSLMLTQ
jgi:hypothetical protein